MSDTSTTEISVRSEPIEKRIYFLRGQKVMLSFDLADLYGVEPKVLVQAVKRNARRFPPDFIFQLTIQEFGNLKSQNPKQIQMSQCSNDQNTGPSFSSSHAFRFEHLVI